jgi:hypothetical protein
MNEPRRREVRRTHLDASAVPVERALLCRAARLESVPEETGLAGGEDTIREWVAAEFRMLAEELHWH